MARMFEVDDLRQGYIDIVNTVIKEGNRVAPRGKMTREVEDVTIVVRHPGRAVPIGTGRGMNLAIGAAETAHLIAGISDAEQLESASKGRFGQFTNNGILKGAYGPRVFHQLGDAVERLASDENTRQAEVMIWRPDDLVEETRDLPCTLSLGFRIRDDKLNMTTHMRSNDVWLGLPYDAWMFTRLQYAVAYALGRQVGTYTHLVDSFHIYEPNVIDAMNLAVTEGDVTFPPPMLELGYTRSGFKDPYTAMNRLRKVRNVARKAMLGDPSTWYGQQLAPHVSISDTIICTKCRYRKASSDFHAGIRRCKACLKEQEERRREADPLRTVKQRCREYGITVDDYLTAMARQGHACAICCAETPGGVGDWMIDHDHVTGGFRGLLCVNCNMGLGHVKDDIDVLKSMIRYLEDYDGS